MKRRRKSKRISHYEKRIIIFICLSSIPMGFILSTITTNLPKTMNMAYEKMIKLGNKIAYDGSAVKKETPLQQQYEETYRTKLNPNWDKEYETIIYKNPKSNL